MLATQIRFFCCGPSPLIDPSDRTLRRIIASQKKYTDKKNSEAIFLGCPSSGQVRRLDPETNHASPKNLHLRKLAKQFF